MKNHFDVLPVQDQEEQGFTIIPQKNTKTQKKQKMRSHHPLQPRTQIENRNDTLIVKVKEDLKEIRNIGVQRPVKGPTDHRLHDRKSGMGRISQPRKNGGGAGGIGNIKDEFNQERIFRRLQEQTGEMIQEQKPVDMPVLTLEEYYQKQGISINDMDKKSQKQRIKKGNIQASWVTQENLTVMKTKEDIENQDFRRKVAVVKQSTYKISNDPDQALLGFKTGLSSALKPREFNEPRQHKEMIKEQGKEEKGPQKEEKDRRQGYQQRKGKDAQGNKKQLVMMDLNEYDFPAL